MTGDGGLIALSLEDADLLIQLGTGRDTCPPWWTPKHDAILDRLREWRARHSEATP